MEMFGKVVSPKKSALNLNGQPELLINHKSGRITLSNELTTKLNCADGMIGFGYDPAKDLGNTPAYMYLLDALSDGCKVGKSGAVTSRFHADRLKEGYNTDLSETANRFRLDVDVENPITYNETTMYPVTFKEELKDITRTRAPHAQVEEDGVVPGPTADCPSSNHDTQEAIVFQEVEEDNTDVETHTEEENVSEAAAQTTGWRSDSH
jgi:hypothetical protein